LLQQLNDDDDDGDGVGNS